MKKALFFALLLIIVAAMTMSCGPRTVSTSTSQSQVQTVGVSRLDVKDSVVLIRRLNAIIRQPKIVVVSSDAAGDTSFVCISADEIIVGDSITMKSNTLVAASDSATLELSNNEESHKETSTPSRPWAWMLAAFGALAALIVLSLRGIGSRR